MGEYWRLRLTPEQLERLQKAIKEYGTQGEIVLPKEYKYEEFKEYIDGIAPHDCIRQIKILFDDFEGEQEEKNREKEIEQIIDEEIHELTQGVIGTISMLNMPTKELNARNNIIKRLKEGEYLK